MKNNGKVKWKTEKNSNECGVDSYKHGVYHHEISTQYSTTFKTTDFISASHVQVIAYLMKENRWSLDEALAYVKERRSCVRPNKGFMEQLHTYEGILNARWAYLLGLLEGRRAGVEGRWMEWDSEQVTGLIEQLHTYGGILNARWAELAGLLEGRRAGVEGRWMEWDSEQVREGFKPELVISRLEIVISALLRFSV